MAFDWLALGMTVPQKKETRLERHQPGKFD
jgi:hypothetical protein